MINPSVRTYRITSALEVLDKKQLSSVQADVVKRDYLVDKLEESESQRLEETAQQDHKPIIIPEQQLMLTAGPGMIGPGYTPGYQNTYTSGMPYQGYSM
uniref:Uncharacterized protein n=1 Tax=Timema tahoe TaxID=61484 RepID=A0A7R9ISK5_9NEOP|nr:unnamed protein product [Timema tahoe]